MDKFITLYIFVAFFIMLALLKLTGLLSEGISYKVVAEITRIEDLTNTQATDIKQPEQIIITPIGQNNNNIPLNLDNDAITGLQSLGFGKREAIQLVTKHQQAGMTTEEIIRKALKGNEI